MIDLDDGELRALLDASFGDGPAHPPLDGTLSAGHRALRRRRTTWAGGAGAAVVALVCGAAVLAGDGLTGGTDPLPPASEAPTGTPSSSGPTSGPAAVPTSTTGVQVRTAELGENDVARIAAAGVLEVDPEATVLETIDDPYDLDDPAWSVALAYELRGETRYLLITTFADETVNGLPLGPRPGFADWVERAVARMPPDFGVETGPTGGDR